MSPITLTTDFGTEDGYAGEVRGVLETRLPGVTVADVTHRIAPGDVESAAWLLERIWERWPPGTVHLAVVDPGVGTDRRAIAALAAERWFVGPDNGLLTRVLARHAPVVAWEIRLVAGAGPVSATFHGRDLFAPAAARLAAGEPPESLGPAIDPRRLVRLPLPAPSRDGPLAVGRVAHVDRFGNVITDIPGEWLPPDPEVEIRGHRLRGLARSYAALGSARGPLLALVGSGGTLEIALARGSAAEAMGARRGDRVTVRPAGGDPERKGGTAAGV